MIKNEKKLILIVGPTAVGKTSLCVELAKKLQSEIFSCDSRQFYKEMNIGTAKPTKEEMDGVIHHFVGNKSMEDSFSAGVYERDAIQALENYFVSKDIAIMTGGSGLYVKAITHGLDTFPEVPQEFRDKLNEEIEKEGLEKLSKELELKDPEYFKTVDFKNKQRVSRALEIIRFTNKPYSYYINKPAKKRNFKIVKIGLELPREVLYERINERVNIMINSGLITEVTSLLPYKDHAAMKTVGYQEVLPHLKGDQDLKTTIELIKRNTRRYAKRQLTWFKNQDTFKWFDPREYEKIENYILKNLKPNRTKNL